MKITFDTAAFAEAAKAVRGVADTSLKIDLMSHARIDVAGRKLRLTVSNFDQEASATIECGEGEVVAAIPFAMVDFFAGRDAGEATVEFDEAMRQAVARHGRARLTMSILKGSDFPMMAEREAEWSFSIRAHLLCNMLTRCERALERNNNTRPHLEGAFVNQRDDGLWIVGSDGHRLHAISTDAVDAVLPIRSGLDLPGIILPARAVKEILRIWSGDESEIVLSGTDTFARIEGKALSLTTKLIDATYVDYPRFIMDPGAGAAEVDTAALMKALDAVLLVPKTEGKGASAKLRAVRLSFGEDGISIYAKGDIGEAEDFVPAAIVDGMAGAEITCVAAYLKEAAGAADAPRIRIRQPAEGVPFFRLEGRDDSVVVVGQRRL